MICCIENTTGEMFGWILFGSNESRDKSFWQPHFSNLGMIGSILYRSFQIIILRNNYQFWRIRLSYFSQQVRGNLTSRHRSGDESVHELTSNSILKLWVYWTCNYDSLSSLPRYILWHWGCKTNTRIWKLQRFSDLFRCNLNNYKRKGAFLIN